MGKIITINREYGSGGHAVGELIAEKLGYRFYDKALVALTAQKSGLTEEFIEEVMETKSTSFMYNLYMSSLPASDSIFQAQAQAVRDIAESGEFEGAVIVGGGADYILQEKADCIKIFVWAPEEFKIARIKKEFSKDAGKQNLTDRDIAAFISKMDKRRRSYYNYFTQNKWGHAADYDLCINAGRGIDKAVETISEFAK